MELWGKLGAFSWRNFWTPDAHEWLRSQAQGVNGTKFIAGLWGVWRQRNNMALDPEPWTVQVAWHKLCHFHDELTQVFSPASFDPGVALNSRWWPAQPSFIEPNSDGSYQEADNCMDGGGLLRDSAGAWTIGYNSFSVGGGLFFWQKPLL